MPNHVHLVLVAETKDGLNLAVGSPQTIYSNDKLSLGMKKPPLAGYVCVICHGREVSFGLHKIYRAEPPVLTEMLKSPQN